jgi:hypothetical protein
MRPPIAAMNIIKNNSPKIIQKTNVAEPAP